MAFFPSRLTISGIEILRARRWTRIPTRSLISSPGRIPCILTLARASTRLEIGIRYVVAESSQAPVAINFTAYGDESDPGPMPVPANAPIEGDPIRAMATGTCWRSTMALAGSTSFTARIRRATAAGTRLQLRSGIYWGMSSGRLPGLRPMRLGFRFSPGLCVMTKWPAARLSMLFALRCRTAGQHCASGFALGFDFEAIAAPMGMRLRLKASFNISGYSAANQVILTALKQYGMIMADNGANMYISGAPDDRWNNDDLHNLDQLPRRI